ncbi:hypothetical protein FDK21_09720 [Cohaesibacter sp. CAU 1516]|uniref:tetratricopeptide repeat protein n=1 Tax=Cohaesibacter sp. CAU 1516 TaxID=2576038 RepID=UPI0010FE9034|nr:hypothetical protein [Cohaesibacter sp. CAU 1516]TLP45907.1 hypothetical protein FDK21_09720 [Cohaesibacter sp. CAU 1516]
MPLPVCAESPIDQEKKIYVEARDDLRDKFQKTHGHFKGIYKKLATFQHHISNWRNATTRRTQKDSISGVKGLITETTGEVRDTAIKTILGDDALKMLKDFEEEVGFEFLPNGEQLDKALKSATGADDLYGYMYQLSALERKMRHQGVFKSVQKVADMFKSAEGYIDDASKVVDFVAVFDPGNVDPNNPISRLDAIDGVLGYMQTFSGYVPGIGKIIEGYSAATKEFAKALKALDKKLHEARMGSICGGIGGDQQKALTRFLIDRRAALDCFRFFTYYEAEAALDKVQAWQHFEADAAFFYAPDGTHAFLSSLQAHNLLGAFQALRQSRWSRNRGLADTDRFMELATFASERGRAEPAARRYLPGYDLCSSHAKTFQTKAFANILKLAGETDQIDRVVNLGGEAILAAGRMARQEYIGLCLFDRDARMTMKRLIERYRSKQIHILQIHARDRGDPPVISGLSLSDGDHIVRRDWMRRSAQAGYVRLPVIVTKGRRIRYALSAPGFKPLRFAKSIRGDEAKVTVLYMDRIEPKPDIKQPDVKRPDPVPADETPSDPPKPSGTAVDDALSDLFPTDEPAGDVPTSDTAGDTATSPESSSPWGQQKDTNDPGQVMTGDDKGSDPFKIGDAETEPEIDEPKIDESEIDEDDRTQPQKNKESTKPDKPSVTISGTGPAISLGFGKDGAYLGQSHSLSVAAPTFETSGVAVPESKAGEIYIGAADDTEDLLPPAKVRYAWKSSPALSFDPAVSSDGRSKVTFTRPGPVKIWAEISNGSETVKSQMAQLKVLIPTFDLQFSPAKAAAAGQSVTASLTASPDLEDRYIAVQWPDPPEANRQQSDRKDKSNTSRSLSFTGGTGETVPVAADVALAATGDRLASVSKAYHFATIALAIKAKRRGPPVKVWDAKSKGLIDATPTTFYVGEAIDLSADFGSGKKPDAIKWRWQGGEGDSLSNPAGSWPTLTRSEAGTSAIRLTILDRNGKELASANTSVSFLKKPVKPSINNKKTKPDKGKKPDPSAKTTPDKAKTKGKPPTTTSPTTTSPTTTSPATSSADDKSSKKEGDKQGARDPQTIIANPTNPPKPPVDPCAPGSNQHKAAAQMWQTALSAVSQSDYDRAFAHFEASLALCSDPKRQQMVEGLRKKLLGPTKTKPTDKPVDHASAPSPTPEPPKPVAPVQSCKSGSSERKAAEYMWTEGLQSAGRRDYPRAIAHLQESLALCPDAKRQSMMEQMRTKLQTLMQQQKDREEAAKIKAANPCANGNARYQQARTKWSDGLNALRLGQNQQALASFQQSVSLCPDKGRQQQIATLKRKLSASKTKSPFETAVNQSAIRNQTQSKQPDQPPSDSKAKDDPSSPSTDTPTSPQTRNGTTKTVPNANPFGEPETDGENHEATNPFETAPSNTRGTRGDTGVAEDGRYKGEIAISSRLAPGEKPIEFERSGNRLTCKFRISHGNVSHSFQTTVRNGRFDQTFTLHGPGGQTVSMRMTGTVTKDQISGDIGPANKQKDHFKFAARRVKDDEANKQHDGTYRGSFAYMSDVRPTVTIKVKGDQISGSLSTNNYQARGQFSARLENDRFNASFRYSASYGYAGDVDVTGTLQQGAIALVMTERDGGKRFRLTASKQ